MAAATIEERVAALEDKVAKLTGEAVETKPEMPWWETITGTFKDDPEYNEAMRLGREWRKSFRPIEDTTDETNGA